MNPKALLPAAALLVTMGIQAHADVEFSNDITFFDVKGTTPAEIYNSILDNSLKIGGKRTLASITTKLTQKGDVVEADGSCKVDGHKIILNFVVNRPRIENEDALAPATREDWEQMSIFIKSHEELHRQIWLSCAQELTAKIDTIAEATCNKTSAAANALWTAMVQDCDKLQKSFDDAQTKALLSQKFFADATQGQAPVQPAE